MVKKISIISGLSRGGIEIVRTWEFLTDTLFSGEGDRHYDAPKRVLGGKDGHTGSLTLNPNTNGEKNLPAKVTNFRIHAGDKLQIKTPSAGGYGDPFEREPKAVLEDVLDELISVEKAKTIYEVVITNKFEIDDKATSELRKN
jgi:N-methylhydantoinase B